MAKIWALLAVTLASVPLSSQHELSKEDICLYGCQETMSNVMFSTTVSTDDYYSGYCNDTLKMQSTCLCAKLHCTPEEITHGMAFIQTECWDGAKIPVPSCPEWIANFTDDDIRNIKVVKQNEITAEEIQNSTLLPDQQLFENAIKTWIQWEHSITHRMNYAWAMWGFWGGVLFLGFVNRIAAIFLTRRYIQDGLMTGKSSSPKGFFSRARQTIRGNIILPAAMGYRHQQPWGWCTLPTRIQSLIIWVYIAINIILCSIYYEAFQDHIYWNTKHQQLWRYVADRTGCISYGNLLFVWLFSARNDIFLWITGWNYATFNQFHRWAARVATAEAIVHSIGYTFHYMTVGGTAQLKEAFHERYWWTGVCATIFMSFILIFSVYPVRLRAYEFFLKTHGTLALISLVMLFYHTIDFEKAEFNNPFLWPCAAVWIFDYVLRGCRLIVLNYKTVFSKSAKATAKYDEDYDIIRIRMHPSYHLRPTPGAHYFIYFPTIFRAMGNHPFTLSSWSYGNKEGFNSHISSSAANSPIEKELTVGTTKTISRASSSEDSSSSPAAFNTDAKATSTNLTLEFVLRPYKGLTSQLRRKLLTSPNHTRNFTAFVEGPYGESAPVFNSHSILFIVGGTGITPALAYMQAYLQGTHKPSHVTKNIHIVWAARHAGFVNAVLYKELAGAASRTDVRLSLFVTGRGLANAKNANMPINEAKAVTAAHPDADPAVDEVEDHRPSVAQVVADEVANKISTLAVFVCGPAGMADDTRAAVVSAVKGGATGVEYFEEQFGW